MGRQARRMKKNFEWDGLWWGLLLEAITCKLCSGSGYQSHLYCASCEGEGTVYPKVPIPGYAVDELPSWWDESSEHAKEHGWQMWEDVSEGSPISPVMDSPEELARWLADNNASAMGSQGASYEQWLSTIKRGWAPSMILDNRGLQSGVAALEEE